MPTKDSYFRLRLTSTERQAIAQLAAHLGVKQSEAVRRAVLMAAQGMNQVQVKDAPAR